LSGNDDNPCLRGTPSGASAAGEIRLPNLENLIGRPDPPPLRIHHIMTAMTAVAIMLSICNSLRQSGQNAFSMAFASGIGFTMAITSGLAATTVGFGFVWRRVGYRFFDQPGHWLLLTQSLWAGIFAMAGILAAVQLPETHMVSSVLMGLALAVVNLVMIGVNLGAAKRFSNSVPWLSIFLLDGLTLVFVFVLESLRLGRLTATFLSVLPIAILVLLLIAVWSDRRQQMPRGWTHWLGVCLRVVPMLHILGRPIWTWVASVLMP
jgi:hypothetical protein